MGSTVLCGRAFIGISRFSSWKKTFAKCRTFATKIEIPPTIEASPKIKKTPTMEVLKDELRTEGIEISSTAYVPKAPGLLMVVSGPSGVGKDTVVHEMVRVYKEKEVDRELKFIVTATTREPRRNEVEGVDYQFVSKETFKEWIANDELYEYSLVYEDYKGVPRKQIKEGLRLGHDCVLRLDVKGVTTMKSLQPNCISVFLAPYSQQALIKRLHSRQTESMEELISRIRSSEEERRCMEDSEIFDYVVENEGKVEDTASKLYAILTVERLRRSRLFSNNKDKRNNS